MQDPDPRRVGGVYWNGYWSRSYVVRSIRTVNGWCTEWTVAWSDGTVTRHSTPWDASRDKILSQPSHE